VVSVPTPVTGGLVQRGPGSPAPGWIVPPVSNWEEYVRCAEPGPFSPTNPGPVLIPLRPLSPPAPGEERGSVPQDANGPLCAAHPGEHGQRPEGGLGQRPALPGHLLPLAVRAHLGLVADEQVGQEEDTELQEWSGEFIPLPSTCLLLSLC